jgi:hypothetical protein
LGAQAQLIPRLVVGLVHERGCCRGGVH